MNRARVMIVVIVVLFAVFADFGRVQAESGVVSLMISEDHYQDSGFLGIPAVDGDAGYADALRQQGGIIRQHKTRTDLTKAGIRNTLTAISARKLLLLFRGQIIRSNQTNRVYLIPVDARPDDLESYISISELNQWMQGIPEQILLLDAYTQAGDLMAYYANREVMGSSALISIQELGQAGSSLVEMLVSVLNAPETDVDANRKLHLQEIYQAMGERFTPSGILVPTGDTETVLLSLASFLQVQTEPPGARVWVNETEVGITPYTREKVALGDYRIRLELEGHYQPEESILKVSAPRGEGAILNEQLRRIRIFGKVHDELGRAIVPTIVRIQGTDLAVEADEEGMFAFEESPLEAGKSYTLEASAGDRIFVGQENFPYAGFEDIRRDILMRQRSWLEIAQERFAQGNLQDAADKFRLAVEDSYELPTLEASFAQMALSYAEEWVRQEPENLNALLAAAQLAEQRNLVPKAKKYWKQAKRRARNGSSEYQFADRRLKALTSWTSYLWIGALILLVLVGSSGGYLVVQQRRKSATT